LYTTWIEVDYAASYSFLLFYSSLLAGCFDVLTERTKNLSSDVFLAEPKDESGPGYVLTIYDGQHNSVVNHDTYVVDLMGNDSVIITRSTNAGNCETVYHRIRYKGGTQGFTPGSLLNLQIIRYAAGSMLNLNFILIFLPASEDFFRSPHPIHTLRNAIHSKLFFPA
jgi:hypothetical protein